jgi:aminoglycoside 3-N-acetyltransferase
LKDLGLKKGDTIIVHSSFGYLNVDLSPMEVIEILKSIITNEGNILMPYYPPSLGIDWLKADNIFDVENTKSSMGVLSNIFGHSENVKISLHPIKAMAVWGKDRDYLIEEHHKSLTPFDFYSPYYKAGLLSGSKSLGLGIEKNAYFHSCEDVIKSHLDCNLYSESIYLGKVVSSDLSEIIVKTFAHCPNKTSGFMSPTDFLKITDCPSYIQIDDKRTRMYIVDNSSVMDHLKQVFGSSIHRGNIKS